MISKLVTLALFLGLASSKTLYDVQRSDVTVYTKLNFDKQVLNQRDKGISIVHYYKSDGKSQTTLTNF